MKTYLPTSDTIENKSVEQAVAQVTNLLKERVEKREGRVMFSLTGQRFGGQYEKGSQQFRVWSGPFGSVTLEHFDSNGHDLIISVDAGKEEMEQFINSLEVLRGYHKWVLEEGLRSYGCMLTVVGQPTIWIG
jgi:hypothetical protein